MHFLVSGKSDAGLLRSNNEDSFLTELDLSLFMVADGMGGHAAGEIASKMAVEVVCDHVKRSLKNGDPFLGAYRHDLSPYANRLGSAFLLANQVIYQASRENSDWLGMGTTLAAAWMPDPETDHLVIAHVGDSRIYLLRDEQLKRLTRDHSLVEEQVEQGLITAKEASRSKVRNMITRAIGQSRQVNVDLAELKVMPGDRLIICSDGLSGMIRDHAIERIINSSERPEQGCSELIESANQHGGRDNISVVLVYFF